MKKYTSIGYLLNGAARLSRQDLSNRMLALGLTFPQWTVLKDLSNHENSDSAQLTMAAIARRLNTRRPNILGMLERLESMGLVNHNVNPDNRRAHIVTLTDKARLVMAELMELSKQTSAKALLGFSSQEEEAVKDYLERIISNLGGNAEETDRESRDNK